MRLVKISTDSDFSCCALDWAVRQFVREFGCWPENVVIGASAYQEDARKHAGELGLGYYGLPPEIMMRDCAWAVVGKDGNTIWSPGA